jgi:hypothetical protein
MNCWLSEMPTIRPLADRPRELIAPWSSLRRDDRVELVVDHGHWAMQEVGGRVRLGRDVASLSTAESH